jgi:hypothetical protein
VAFLLGKSREVRQNVKRRFLLLLALVAVPVFVPLADGKTEPKARLIKTIPVPPLNGIPQEPLRIYDGRPNITPPPGPSVTLTVMAPVAEAELP